MSLPRGQDRELSSLLLAIGNGVATDNQSDRAREMLMESAEARSVYFEHVAFMVALRWSLEQPSLIQDHDESDTFRETFVHLAEHSESGTRPTIMSRSLSAATRFPARTLLATILLVAAGCYGAFGLIAWNLRPNRLPQAIDGAQESVAVIQHSEDVRWSEASAKPPESTVLNGERLQTTSGLIELELKSGVHLQIEGPSEWTIYGDNRARLHAGKLIATVSPRGVGFMLETPTATIVDLGTEFGVEVDRNGATTAHVYAGKIQVAREDDRNGAATTSPLVVTAGQSIRASGETGLISLPAPAGAKNDFLRKPHANPRAEMGSRPPQLTRTLPKEIGAKSQQFPNTLVAYWNFDEQNTEGIAWDLRGKAHGSLVGVERVTGLIGAGGVRFKDAPQQAVWLPAYSLSGAFIDGLTVEAVIVSNWNGKLLNYDEIFRMEGTLLLSLQNDRNDDVDGPVLGLDVASLPTLNMPLDGREGRPSLAELTDDNLHHIVGTCDANSRELAVYVDGIRRFRVIGQLPVAIKDVQGAAPLIGNSERNLKQPFNGVIDEVAVYSAALSAAEVAKHWERVRRGLNYYSEN